AELAKLFHGNRTLKRAAVLHADVSVFVDNDFSRQGADLDSGPYLVEDGRPKSVRSVTAHWNIGRQLLNDIQPSPAGDPDAQLWYEAVSAHLLNTGNMSEGVKHLTQARRLFPRSPFFLL